MASDSKKDFPAGMFFFFLDVVSGYCFVGFFSPSAANSALVLSSFFFRLVLKKIIFPKLTKFATTVLISIDACLAPHKRYVDFGY